MVRIAFYFTHCETLGHTTRIFSLANGLKRLKPNSEFLFLQGGKELTQKDEILDCSKIVDLPNPFYSKYIFKGEKCKLSLEETKERIEAMYVALTEFKPDIFVTEYFPFGREDCMNELVTIIKWLRNKNVKIFASIGYPVISTSIEKINSIIGSFEKIIVHSPKEMDLQYLQKYLKSQQMDDNAKWYEEFFNKYKNEIHFTGYVLPDIEKLKTEKKEKIILVSRGGGVIYPKLIINGIKIAPYFKEYKFVAVGGPASSSDEQKIFRVLAKKYGVEYYEKLPSLSEYIAKSSASISMSGYGTATQLLYFGTPALLVPREKEDNKFYLEQRYRAYMLEQMGFGKAISYENSTAESMAESLKEVLHEKPKKMAEENFNGAEETAKVMGL